MTSCQKQTEAEKRTAKIIEQQLNKTYPGDIVVFKTGDIAVVITNFNEGNIRYALLGQQCILMDSYLLSRKIKRVVRYDEKDYVDLLKMYVRFKKVV